MVEPVLGVTGFNQWQQVFNDEPGVPLNEEVGCENFAIFCRVDVDVDLHGVNAELVELPGDAIVPTGTDRHDEIAVDNILVGVGRAMHPQHAEVKRVSFICGALAEQRVDDWRAELFSKAHDRLARTGNHRAVAHI